MFVVIQVIRDPQLGFSYGFIGKYDSKTEAEAAALAFAQDAPGKFYVLRAVSVVQATPALSAVP